MRSSTARGEDSYFSIAAGAAFFVHFIFEKDRSKEVRKEIRDKIIKRRIYRNMAYADQIGREKLVMSWLADLMSWKKSGDKDAPPFEEWEFSLSCMRCADAILKPQCLKDKLSFSLFQTYQRSPLVTPDAEELMDGANSSQNTNHALGREVVDDLSVSVEGVKIHDGASDLVAGGRNIEEGAVVRTGESPSDGDNIVLGNHLLKLPLCV